MTMNALRAESRLIRARRIPVFFAATWGVMICAFSLGIPFIVYLSIRNDPLQDSEPLLDVLLLQNFPITAIGSYPMFGSAMMLVLGVLVAGSEFRWGTWTARLTQGPSRAEVMTAKTLTGIATAGFVTVVAYAMIFALSLILTLSLGAPLVFPGAGQMASSLVAAWGISSAWVIVGLGLSMVFRGTMVPVIIGLLWILGVENIVTALAGMLSWLAPVRYLLLGAASGSIASAVGAPSLSEGGTPGVSAATPWGWAVAIIILYSVLAYLLSLYLSRTRDIN